MSVRENARKEGDLLVIVKAKEHAIYALRATANEKYFPKRHRFSVVKFIQTLSIKILMELIEANEIIPETRDEFLKRRKLQKKAAAKCRSLMALIDISKTSFDINYKKINHWISLVVEIRRMTIRWMKSDYSRYSHLLGDTLNN